MEKPIYYDKQFIVIITQLYNITLNFYTQDFIIRLMKLKVDHSAMFTH